MVLDCCEELCRYYRELCNWENRARFKLNKPAWGSHISVICNECPPRQELWGLRSGGLIEFQYEPILNTNGQYYWLSVVCDELLDIREQMGLKREPFYALHLTVGIDLSRKVSDDEAGNSEASDGYPV